MHTLSAEGTHSRGCRSQDSGACRPGQRDKPGDRQQRRPPVRDTCHRHVHGSCYSPGMDGSLLRQRGRLMKCAGAHSVQRPQSSRLFQNIKPARCAGGPAAHLMLLVRRPLDGQCILPPAATPATTHHLQRAGGAHQCEAPLCVVRSQADADGAGRAGSKLDHAAGTSGEGVPSAHSGACRVMRLHNHAA